MKLFTLCFLLLLLTSCESVYRSYCGCPETKVYRIEDRIGYIRGDTLIYETPKDSETSWLFPYDAAIICNGAILDSLPLTRPETKVVFSGETFENCNPQQGDKIDDLIHLHDVVRGPKGFNER